VVGRVPAVVVTVVTVVVLSLVLIWALQRHLIYLPATARVPPAASVLPGAEDVTLKTSDGLRLGAWMVPPQGPHRGVTVLVAGGNAGDRSARAPLAAALAAKGLAVLLFDYRGYGGNPGSPSEEGLARDAGAAQRYLVEERGVPPDRLLYYGESLGSAVVTRLATQHPPPAGLVLRSPFVDLASVGQVHYPFLPVKALLRDRYPLTEQLATVRVPVTVVYGDDDSVVPPDQSRAVAASAPTLKALVQVPGADHNDRSLLDGRRLVNAVVALADQVDGAGGRETQGF
jgi:alpha-beta hydrolase superfamily lysophospholipase